MTENITEEGLPAGNLCDKYTTRNPIYRMIMSGYFRDVRELVDRVKDDISTASEIGCGEGYLASYLSSLGYPRFVAATFRSGSSAWRGSVIPERVYLTM